MLYYEIRDRWGNGFFCVMNDAWHSDFEPKNEKKIKNEATTTITLLRLLLLLRKLLLLFHLKMCLVLHNSRFRACLAYRMRIQTE